MEMRDIEKPANADKRILAAATTLFSKLGYNGVSAKDVAVSACVSEVTLYRRFRSKRNLYDQVLSTGLQNITLRGEHLTDLAGAETASAVVARVFELICSVLREQQEFLRLLRFSILEMDDEVDARIQRHIGPLIEVVARYIDPWIESGAIRAANSKALIATLIAIGMSDDVLSRVFSHNSPAVGTLSETFAEFCCG